MFLFQEAVRFLQSFDFFRSEEGKKESEKEREYLVRASVGAKSCCLVGWSVVFLLCGLRSRF